MRLVVLVAAAAVAVAAPASVQAAHGASGVVAQWKIAGLKIGVATEADVIETAGEPDRILNDDNDYTGARGVVLGHHCSGRFTCQTAYGIDRAQDRLVNFSTRSKRFRTPAGTRVGHSRRRAKRQEGRRPRGGCNGWSITKRRGDRFLSVVVNARWVTDISSTGAGGGPYFSC